MWPSYVVIIEIPSYTIAWNCSWNIATREIKFPCERTYPTYEFREYWHGESLYGLWWNPGRKLGKYPKGVLTWRRKPKALLNHRMEPRSLGCVE